MKHLLLAFSAVIIILSGSACEKDDVSPCHKHKHKHHCDNDHDQDDKDSTSVPN